MTPERVIAAIEAAADVALEPGTPAETVERMAAQISDMVARLDDAGRAAVSEWMEQQRHEIEADATAALVGGMGEA
jgi:hypothetical protein